MAFRASNVIPANKYERAKQLAIQLKRFCQGRATAYQSGANGAEILSTVDALREIKNQLQDCASVPGIAAYAAAQEDDGTYNVAAEFTALMNAIDAAITEIVTTLPKDGSGYLLVRKINPDGTLEERSFSGGALSSLRSLLTTIVSQVN